MGEGKFSDYDLCCSINLTSSDRLGLPGSTRERVWVRPKNTSNIRIPNAGHLVCHILCSLGYASHDGD